MSHDETRLTGDDDQALRMLAGAHFGPDVTVVLPSGVTIGGDEAQALTAAYVDSDPAIGAFCDRLREALAEQHDQSTVEPPRRWWEIWRKRA